MKVTTDKAVIANDAFVNRLRIWWIGITALIAGGIFLQAGFAGAMLSGSDFAQHAHRLAASVLVAATLIAGVFAVVALRRIANGTKLGLTLLALAGALVLQFMVGKLSSKGANLLWMHVPLGAALFGLAALAIADALRLNAGSGGQDRKV
jgi:heme A synthase